MTSSRLAAGTVRMDVLVRGSHSARLPLLPRGGQRRCAQDPRVSSSALLPRHPLFHSAGRSNLSAARARESISCRASFNGYGRRSSRARDDRSHAQARAEGGMWQGEEGEERGRRDAGRSASGGAGPAWMGMGAGEGGARAGVGDAQRLLIGGVVLAAVTWLKFATDGHLGWLGDGALEGVAQLWFVFYLLDVALTTATWIVGKLTSSLAVANSFHPHALLSPASHALPSTHSPLIPPAGLDHPCLLRSTYEDGRFQQADGSSRGFNSQSRSQSQVKQGWRATGTDRVVDVEATVVDKD
ncbi:unnamed protein product [Closterium sp. Yama58-4]|nr:unnamed protein product [Closterium sp. Yama58-4]